MGIKIIGTGRALPEKCMSNDELSAFLDTSDEWITSHTGIKNRYLCTEESLVHLAEAAARKAMQKSGTKPEDIDLIICATVSGDYLVPSLACCVSELLRTECPAFDVNAGCTGFVYGLDVAAAYITSGKAKRVLFICADMLTKMLNWQDRATCVLFGDGAGALVLSEGSALKYIHLTARGNTKVLYIKGTPPNNPLLPAANMASKSGLVEMDGQEVFRFAVKAVEQEANIAFEKLGLTPEDISFFLLHQANKRIIDSARARLKQPPEKFPTNIERYSNTTAATIPILLDEMVETSQIKPGDRLMAIAFGAGLTTGSCVIEW